MEATDISQALIARCRQRDRQAYQQLVSQLMRPAYFQALALMGNADDALDVSQDALARAMGANAITDVLFSTSYIMSGAAEILVYGTAVVVEDL